MGRLSRVWVGWLSSLSLAVVPTTWNPALGAERIYISYSVFERSVPVEALEIYAKEGRITPELAAYTRYFNSRQLTWLRRGLHTRVNLDPVTISNFLYTPTGELLLQRLGQIIQTPSRQPGFFAIRAALILAAAEPEGLTALSVLREFPTQGIRVDLAESLAILREIQKLVSQTEAAVAAVRNQSLADTSVASGDVALASGAETNSLLGNLGLSGPFAWQKETLQLTDLKRVGRDGTARTFPADIYLPRLAKLSSSPVIVISHGLGSDRKAYQYLAEHLASYGFVVAIPEHPGSSERQLLALLNGQADDVAEPREFVDRPLDIKLLLDELTVRSQWDPTFQGRLNLQQVGVAGHSFGGYTALALAGAKIDFERLRQDCATNLNNTLNISLVLQCRALVLPRQNYDLSDPRVKAVIAINPIDSSILGPSSLSQIRIPVMLVTGSADTVAPALHEQIQPFTWLTTPQRYLMLIEGASHFSTIGEEALASAVFRIPPEVVGPAPNLARSYLKAFSTSFFETHVAGQTDYARYLTPAYATAITQAPLPLSLNQTLTAARLREALGEDVADADVSTPQSSPAETPLSN